MLKTSLNFNFDLSIIELVLWTICTWYFCNLMDWLLHTMSHIPTKIPILNTIHRIHMTHHKLHYPITKLLRSKPYKSGGGEFAFGPIIVLLYTLLYLLLPTRIIWIVRGSTNVSIILISACILLYLTKQFKKLHKLWTKNKIQKKETE